MQVNPLIKWLIISLIIIILLGFICLSLLDIKPLCQVGKRLSSLIHRNSILGLWYVELLDYGLHSDVEDMQKTSGLIGSTWEVFQEHREVLNHCIIIGCIVGRHTQDLFENVSIYLLSLQIDCSDLVTNAEVF
jgi:hypothetical protein